MPTRKPSSPSIASSKAAAWLPWALALVALAFAAYLPALRAGYVWDDEALTQNPLITKPGGLLKLWTEKGANEREEHYWPLVYTTFWFEQKLWGLNPAGYHFTNLLLHAANVLLLWRLLAGIRARGAWLGAALFALHPVHVESVAWVIERKDTLCGLFYLGSALAYVRFARGGAGRNLGAALGLFVCAMLSKSAAVGLPVALAIWLWAERGRVERRDLASLAPFFAAALAIVLFDLSWVARRGGYDAGFSAPDKIVLASRAILFYLGKLLWPSTLMAIYPRWAIDARSAQAWSFPAAVAAITLALWAARGKLGRWPLAAWLFYIVALAPTLGLVDFRFMRLSLAADRFQYLPSLAPVALLGFALAELAARLPAWPGGARRAKPAAAAALLLLLGALTFRQSALYRDSETLFGDNLKRSPADGRLRRDYAGRFADSAFELLARGDAPQAEALCRKGVAADPLYPQAFNYLGEALAMQGKLGEAALAFESAIKLQPDYSLALGNLAAVRQRQGRAAEAAELAARAKATRPDPADAPIRFGGVAAPAGDWSLAEGVYAKGVRGEPDSEQAWFRLGAAQLKLGKAAEAADSFARAAALRPSFAEARFAHGIALLVQGRDQEAIALFNDAMALRPELKKEMDRLKGRR